MDKDTDKVGLVPNLDAMDDDELRAFREVYEGSRLAHYATLTLNARRFRWLGKIERALLYEGWAEDQYKALKPCQRW